MIVIFSFVVFADFVLYYFFILFAIVFFVCCFLFFFFKQKTAYEMRISDWSSDVCSSDLVVIRIFAMDLMFLHRIVVYEDGLGREQDQIRPAHLLWQILVDVVARDIIVAAAASVLLDVAHILIAIPFLARSEEHTSELQSLMRISYAVFCLKKHNINSF